VNRKGDSDYGWAQFLIEAGVPWTLKRTHAQCWPSFDRLQAGRSTFNAFLEFPFRPLGSTTRRAPAWRERSSAEKIGPYLLDRREDRWSDQAASRRRPGRVVTAPNSFITRRDAGLLWHWHLVGDL